MLEAAERSALHRRRLRIIRVDLHDPAETVSLVRLLFHVESLVKARERVARTRAEPIALVVPRLGRLREVSAEIHVEVFFRRKHRAPRRPATSAVVERAD